MKPIAARLLLYCLFLVTIVAPACATAELIELETDTNFESVYLLEDKSTAVVTVALFVLAGEVDVQGPEGLSHYLEHLMYWHADNAGDGKPHARGGNAWVNGIVTSYYSQSESSDLPELLEFISRLYSKPELKKDFMIRERSVVAREYDFRVSENPDWRARTEIRRDLYNQHPVSRSVIGTLASINSLTLMQANEFHHRYYHPQNSVLFISGDLTAPKAVETINEYLSSVEDSGSKHTADWRNGIVTERLDKTTVFADSQAGYERLKYLSLSQFPEGSDATSNWYTLLMLESVIDSVLEGGVARPLRIDNFILRSFSIQIDNVLKNSFEFFMYAEPDKGVTLLQATDAISQALQDIAENGIPKVTLDRVRKRMLQTALRQSDNLGNTYDRMARQLTAGISPVTGDQHIKNIKAVSLVDVNQLLNALAKPRRRSIAHIKPAGE